MEIKKYEPTLTPPSELIELLQKKYGERKNFECFLSDYQKAFHYCSDNENIIFVPLALFEAQKMRAHCALIIDRRLPQGECFFGFFDVPDDPPMFRFLWNSVVEEARARGISVLHGPINGSIWHQYRCIKETDGSEFFKFELFGELYYYQFFVLAKPFSEHRYYSGYRTQFDALLPLLQPAYHALEARGFFIKKIKKITPALLQTLFSLSIKVFQQNWGFTAINQKEFLFLYSSEKLESHLDTIYVLYKASEIIGFCTVFKESESTWICKTIGILPEYQGLGLGNALAFKLHSDAKEQGIEKIMYALIREDNKIKNFPNDDVIIFRRYAAFEFHI